MTNKLAREPLTLDRVHPDRLYTAGEAAEALDLHPNSIYRLGQTVMLPKVPLGPRGGITRFRGRDILRYARIIPEAVR